MKPVLKGEPGWSHEQLAAIIDAIRLAYGRDLSRFDHTFLRKSLQRRCELSLSETQTSYFELLLSDSAEASALLQSLQIHHSELFRDPLTFALLEHRILPDLLEQMKASGRTELRAWSAGCAAGQEAYSLAILLSELSECRGGVPFRIFATDTSEAQLGLAHVGVFASAAMRNVRLCHLDRWFTRQGHSYLVDPALKEQVEFSVYDLFDEHSTCPPASIFGEFDFILCCNLLFYYQAEGRRFILDKLRRSLVPGGFLITGETERQNVQNAGGYRSVSFQTDIFQTVSERPVGQECNLLF